MAKYTIDAPECSPSPTGNTASTQVDFPGLKGEWIFLIGMLISNQISGGSRIFPRGGAPTPKIAIIFHLFTENCMKMKEFGPPGGGARPWRPLGSANADRRLVVHFVLVTLEALIKCRSEWVNFLTMTNPRFPLGEVANPTEKVPTFTCENFPENPLKTRMHSSRMRYRPLIDCISLYPKKLKKPRMPPLNKTMHAPQIKPCMPPK